MKITPWLLPLVAVATLSQTTLANDTVTFDSCTDVTGHTVVAEADDSVPILVTTTYQARQPTIRYNPALLPNLPATARQFFYAYECARHALGDAGKAPQPLARVRQADCVGLNTLLKSGLLVREQVAALQESLNFTAAEWTLLPGPPRSFNLAACRTSTGALRLPTESQPSVRQTELNACLRACADRLWRCQNACRGNACEQDCLTTHQQCEAPCGTAPGNSP